LLFKSYSPHPPSPNLHDSKLAVLSSNSKKKQEMKFGFKGIKQQNGVDFIHKLSYFASLSLKMRWKLVCWLA
jgi:hypothetical protein